MFKKLLAGLTALALSLGIVALTAGPASAHHSTITATVACTSPTNVAITWSVQNWNGGKTGQVQSSTNNLVPAGTEFASNETKQYVQNVTSTGTYSLSVTMKWWNGSFWANQTTNSGSKQISSSHFSACAEVEPADPTFTNAQCTGPGTYGQASYTIPTTANVVYKVRINNGSWNVTADGTYFVNVGTKVDVHADSVDPYQIDGQDDWSKTFGTPDCDVEVEPTKPTIVEAVCTGEGQVGLASYTIPSITGVKYQISSGGSSGPWTDIAAGVYDAADGSSVWIQAVALSGYDIDGTSKWKLEFDDVSSWKCDVPAAPTFTAQVCTGPGTSSTASYTIPNDNGIKYQVRINGGSWQNVSAGTVNVTVFPRLIEVQALADGNIIVAGSTTYWSHNFTSAGDCLVNVYPAAPDWTDSICQSTTTGSTQATYEVVATANVSYQVSTNGVDYSPISAGVYNATVGSTVWIKAVAATGYVLAGDTGPWSHTFTNPGECLDEAFPVEPAWTDSICEANTTGSTQATFEVFAAANVSYEVSTDGGNTWNPISAGVHNASPGDTVMIRAIADSGYELDGYTAPWSHTFTDPGDCYDESFPGDPLFVDSVCTGPGTSSQATYKIVAAANVTYEVSFDNVTFTTVGASVGVHNAVPGTDIWIKAIADPGYEILGQDLWHHAFADPGDCLEDASIDPVVASDQRCVLDDPETLEAHLESGTITIPSTAHVTYYVDGLEKSAGVHDYAPGTYTISAVAETGYKLTGVPDPWMVTIEPADICGQLPDLPLVTPVVTFVQTTCSASGSYTLAADPIENAAGIFWTVSGGLPNTLGTHSVATVGTVNITATADGPDYGFPRDADGIIEWSYDFVSIPDDCLPTLALTGGSIAAGALGLSTLLTLGGILLVTARRRDAMAIGE